MEELERNNKIGFVVHQTSKVLLSTTIDIALSPLPSAFSNAIKEIIGLYPKFKQEKLNEFYLSFFNCLEQNSGYKINKLNFTNDDFLNVLLSISDKVIMTKSQLKLECFKNILLNKLKDPVEDQYTQKFIRSLDELNEIQIFILMKIENNRPLNNLTEFALLLDKTVIPKQLKANEYRIEIDFGFQKIITNLSEIDFNLKGLISTGFINFDKNVHLNNEKIHLLEHATGEMITLSENFYISIFGEKFLYFIKQS